ncbi:hypothetical protein STTU_3478 [Streptomyces sp. Tu6071]|nr:hypothetical protein STTU_3478 [Streptomyces sp. Tu6071]
MTPLLSAVYRPYWHDVARSSGDAREGEAAAKPASGSTLAGAVPLVGHAGGYNRARGGLSLADTLHRAGAVPSACPSSRFAAH